MIFHVALRFGALKRRRAYFGVWRSLVARLLWEQDVAGSNPVTPTAKKRP